MNCVNIAPNYIKEIQKLFFELMHIPSAIKWTLDQQIEVRLTNQCQNMLMKTSLSSHEIFEESHSEAQSM